MTVVAVDLPPSSRGESSLTETMSQLGKCGGMLAGVQAGSSGGSPGHSASCGDVGLRSAFVCLASFSRDLVSRARCWQLAG